MIVSRTWILGVLGSLSCLAQTSAPEDPSHVLAKYLALPREATTLRAMTMEATIDGALPKLKKQGTMKLTRAIDAAGKSTYKVLSFEGDDQVKKDVIGRYLNLERETQTEAYDVGINEKNYKFHFKARLAVDGHSEFVYRIEPRRKAQGLLKGELWLDGETGLPLRETGRFVKNPSLFFKKTDVDQRYRVANGKALITNRDMLIETRIVGKVEMKIQYTNHQPLAEAPATPAP